MPQVGNMLSIFNFENLLQNIFVLKKPISFFKKRRKRDLRKMFPSVCRVTWETGFFCVVLYHHLPKMCVQITVLQTENICATLRLTCHLVISCLESKLYSFSCVFFKDKWNAGVLMTSVYALDKYYILKYSHKNSASEENGSWLVLSKEKRKVFSMV
jgi:hypothetical protein